MKNIMMMLVAVISTTMAMPAFAAKTHFLECVISQGRDGGRLVRIPVDTEHDLMVPSTYYTDYKVGDSPLYEFSAQVNNVELAVEVMIRVKAPRGLGATISGSDKILYQPEFGNINTISNISCDLKPM